MRIPVAAAALALLGACTQPDRDDAAGASAPPAGVVDFSRIDDDPAIQSAASVIQIDPIPGADAKLFGAAGGDPAINGVYTYLAVFAGPAEGWTVFRIGDFNSYKVEAATPEQVTLLVSRSWIDAPSGDVKTAQERLIVKVPEAGAGRLEAMPAR